MKLTIDVPLEDVDPLARFLETTQHAADGTSHGPLTLERLALMLLQDVALSVRRPGSWEGANMRSVLASHGYHS